MKRISMNELTTYRWTFEEDVQNYAEAGIPAICVWREKLADFGEERGVELIHESGLQVSALQWAGGFTGSDGRSFRESVQDAREAIQLAAALRTRCLIVYSGARGGHTHNHARRLLRAAISELLPLADEFGVALAIEPMHPGCAAEWTFLTDLQDTLEFVRGFESPQMQLAFDAYHWAHDPAVIPLISEFAKQTAIVQLGDARTPPDGEQNRCRIGEGTLPFSEVLNAFLNAGYEGFFDIELMGEDLEAADYRDLILHSKATVQALSAATN